MGHTVFISDGFLVLGGGAWFMEVRLLLLLGFVASAAASDLRERRIPNHLVLLGIAAAFLWHVFNPHELSWAQALGGMAAGFGVLLPLYLLRGMAAGDVKLMAMVGAYLGSPAVLWVVLLTFLLGGAWALAWMALRGAWPRVRANLGLMLRAVGHGQTLQSAGSGIVSAGSIPYGVVIAAGTLLLIVLIKTGVVVA